MTPLVDEEKLILFEEWVGRFLKIQDQIDKILTNSHFTDLNLDITKYKTPNNGFKPYSPNNRQSQVLHK